MCIQDITSEIELPHGRKLIDKLRFFHGDDPSAQLEAGHQKGGNYFCPTCTIKATETYCLHKFYRTDVETLKMKQEKVLKGPVTSSNIKIGRFPFTGLSKENLVTELRSRGLIKESYQDKKSMESVLSQELCGTKMVPALRYGNEFETVESKIPNYEVLPVEPCHDIPGHIKNIYDELPHHLIKEEKEILEYAITTSFNKRDTKSSVDYRKSIIIVTAYCRDKICSFAQELLETMVNI